MACDAEVLPIVLGSNSQPLDVGTEQRFVTRAIRRALNKRDKGCVVCKAPPSQCEAHHLIHWANGGPTSLNNLVLLCPAHHHALHAGHWTITISDGIVNVTRPTWTNPSRTRFRRPPAHAATPDHAAARETSRRQARPIQSDGEAACLAEAEAEAEAAAHVGGEASAWPDVNATAQPAENQASVGPVERHLIGLDRLLGLAPANSDLSWNTPEAAARLNPWGEMPDEPTLADTG